MQVAGWTSPLLRLTELACWATGALLLSVQVGSSVVTQYGHDSALRSFEEARAAAARSSVAAAPAVRRGLGYAEPDQSLWAPERIRRYHQERWGLAGLPEAVIRIARLGLEVPVFDGATESNMTVGAGRIAGSPAFGEPGNVGLSSHRDGYFRRLKDIRVGDVIVVDTLSRSFRYVVEEIRITDPADTTVLWPGSVPEVTLVTCYPFYHFGNAPQRYVVRAELREETP
jgi:LPXTG-site transpeptidase (sortase) family protein